MLSPVLFLALSATVALACASIRHIPEGQVYTLRRFGRQSRSIGPGMHLVLPLVERVAHKISLLGQVVHFPVASKEHGNSAAVSGNIYFQVLNADRADHMIDGLEGLLRERTLALIEAGSCACEEESLVRNDRIKRALNLDLRDSGILVTRVQLNLE